MKDEFLDVINFVVFGFCQQESCDGFWTMWYDGPNIKGNIIKTTESGWWFGTFFIFLYIEKNNPTWLIVFRGAETNNQKWFDSCYDSTCLISIQPIHWRGTTRLGCIRQNLAVPVFLVGICLNPQSLKSWKVVLHPFWKKIASNPYATYTASMHQKRHSLFLEPL